MRLVAARFVGGWVFWLMGKLRTTWVVDCAEEGAVT